MSGQGAFITVIPKKEWMADKDATVCVCERKFNTITRKHHCRGCGKVFCNLCCPEIGLTREGDVVRTCNKCMDAAQAQAREARKAREAQKKRLIQSRIDENKRAVAAKSTSTQASTSSSAGNQQYMQQRMLQQQAALANAQQEETLKAKEAATLAALKKQPEDLQDVGKWKLKVYNLIKIAPKHEWIKDETVAQCQAKMCGDKFTTENRRHHCRVCGNIFCHNCSPAIGRLKPSNKGEELRLVRICEECCIEITYRDAQYEEAAREKEAKRQRLLKKGKNAQVVIQDKKNETQQQEQQSPAAVSEDKAEVSPKAPAVKKEKPQEQLLRETIEPSVDFNENIDAFDETEARIRAEEAKEAARIARRQALEAELAQDEDPIEVIEPVLEPKVRDDEGLEQRAVDVDDDFLAEMDALK